MDNSFDLPLPFVSEGITKILLGENIDGGLFTAEQLRAAVEAERAKFAAALQMVHRYDGGCPDDFAGWHLRDPNCPACRALVALGIGEFT